MKRRRGRWTHLPVCLFFASTSFATTISGVTLNAPSVAQYDKLEVTFDLDQSYTNPFDPDEVDARAVITLPDTSQVEIPAFHHMEYDLVGTGVEFIQNGRNPAWKARFAPWQTGTHSIDLSVTDIMGTTTVSNAATFGCVAGAKPGFIRADPVDSRFLRRSSGEPYIPIGRNVSWADNSGSNLYDSTFTTMNANGQNFVRIWMTHFFRGQIIEWSSDHFTGHFEGVGRFSLQQAHRIDRIVELAEQNGIAIQLALQHHGQFSTTVNPNWSENPYNIANVADGGFLSSPDQFFTDPAARDLFKRKLRYIVARWGYSTSIFAWELFNEVQFTDNYRTSAVQRANVAAWHDEMAEWLQNNDPFDHLITTSSEEIGFENIWSLDNIDLMQVHDYDDNKIAQFVDHAGDLAAFDKPVVFGEYGAAGTGSGTPEFNIGAQGAPRSQQLQDGLVLHNGLWSSLHLGSSAMYWWWEYIESESLDDHFAALALYADGIDFASENLGTATVAFSGAGSVTNASAFPGVTDFFGVSAQTAFTMQSDGSFPGVSDLNVYLHGTFQSALRSDPEFNVGFEAGGSMTVHVTEVSGAGNNSIRILVDGSPVLNQNLTNGQTNFTITTPVAAGNHVVQVENTGQDWVRIDEYEFTNVTTNSVGVIGLSGPLSAYLWIYDLGSQYGRLDNGLISGVTAAVEGLDDGDYALEFHDTRPPGGITSTATATSSGGTLTFALPTFEKDMAIKVMPPKVAVTLDAFLIQ